MDFHANVMSDVLSDRFRLGNKNISQTCKLLHIEMWCQLHFLLEEGIGYTRCIKQSALMVNFPQIPPP